MKVYIDYDAHDFLYLLRNAETNEIVARCAYRRRAVEKAEINGWTIVRRPRAARALAKQRGGVVCVSKSK